MAEQFFSGARTCAVCGEKLDEKEGWRYPKNLGREPRSGGFVEMIEGVQ